MLDYFFTSASSSSTGNFMNFSNIQYFSQKTTPTEIDPFPNFCCLFGGKQKEGMPKSSQHVKKNDPEFIFARSVIDPLL